MQKIQKLGTKINEIVKDEIPEQMSEIIAFQECR